MLIPEDDGDEDGDEDPGEYIRTLLDEPTPDDGFTWRDDWNDGDRVFTVFLPPEVEHVRATTTKSQQFAMDAREGSAAKSFDEVVPEHYRDFRAVFEKQSFDALPDRRPWDHAIELKPGDLPKSTKLYPLSLNEQKELDDFLAENLASGRIRPSKSPVAAPVFFVKKKDGGLRFVQDYRRLNAVTVKNSYPLPLISELVNKLRKARVFTKLDVRWGFNNVRIKEGDEWKAAFRTNKGLFEPLVMFFGLTNSPATFQTMMNALFEELISRGVVVVYMDDILIFTETLEEHQRVVREVLEVLRKNNLYLKPEKCEFERERIESASILTRVAPSFIRIGSFEALNPPQSMFFLGGGQQEADLEALRVLGEWVSRKVLRLGLGEGEPWGKALLFEVARRNARMVAGWQAYGFMHGVINTDKCVAS